MNASPAGLTIEAAVPPPAEHHGREAQAECVHAIRRLLTPDLLQEFDQPGQALDDAFTTLRALQPGQTEAAMQCHRVLLREVRVEVREWGWIDARWADVTRHLFTYLEAAGYLFHEGRWMPYEEWVTRSLATPAQ